MFTRFMDMHSGGGLKEAPYQFIYIEAPLDEAKVVFYNRFGHSPERISCTCCGEDYSLSESGSLERESAYDRKCVWDKKTNDYDLSTAKVSIDEYLKRPDVLVIRAADIKDEERRGEVPEQGYRWIG